MLQSIFSPAESPRVGRAYLIYGEHWISPFFQFIIVTYAQYPASFKVDPADILPPFLLLTKSSPCETKALAFKLIGSIESFKGWFQNWKTKCSLFPIPFIKKKKKAFSRQSESLWMMRRNNESVRKAKKVNYTLEKDNLTSRNMSH